VDELLPLAAKSTGPVSLRWLGAEEGGLLTAVLGIDRARNVAEFREALRPWHVPTFNAVVADVEGHIAVQCTGRIPLRQTAERGYRDGSDPAQQWTGLIPFDAMPHAFDPPRGWLATANNRLAGDDYPYPLAGTWISGYRAKRIRQMIEPKLERATFDRGDFGAMHQDAISLRAVNCLTGLLAVVAELDGPQERAAIALLKSWDSNVLPELAAPTLFNVFFSYWSKAVADVHFEEATAELLAKQCEGVASRLLAGDPHGWFAEGQRLPTIRRVFSKTLAHLTQRFGPNPSEWQWGRLHRMPLLHVLGGRGDLAQLLNHGDVPVRGDMATVCNTGSDPDWRATTGAGYRLIADLATRELHAIDAQSQSGAPGTPHYSDQLAAWSAGEYHVLPLDRDQVAKIAVERITLLPAT
jgi:penicillin amidase